MELCNICNEKIIDHNCNNICDNVYHVCKTCSEITNLTCIKFNATINKTRIYCHICMSNVARMSSLKSHIKTHNENRPKYKCEICNKEYVTTKGLSRHIKTHNENRIKFKCEICNIEFTRKDSLKSHIKTHNENRPKLKCEICNTEFTRKSSLKDHIKTHSENRPKFKCEICENDFASLSSLKKHIRNVHDIGTNICDVCFEPKHSKNEYTVNKLTSTLCNMCYASATGKNSRKETIWSDYLDKHLGIEYLLGSDKSLKSLGGCQSYRPDKIYTSDTHIEIDECDEFQHTHSVNYSCDEKRISDIYDEPFISGKYLIITRYNPDKYIPPDGYNVITKQDERLQILVELKKKLRNKYKNNQQEMDLIHIYYLFYDQTNELITKNMKHTMVYNLSDIQLL